MAYAANPFATTAFAGQELVAVSVSGFALTATAGSPHEITGDANHATPLGVAMTLTLGSETGHIIKIPTGESLTSSIGFVPNDNLVVSSISTATGFSLSTTLGSVSILATIGVDVTGEALTLSLGDESIITTATATPTGVLATLTPGSPTLSGTSLIIPTGVTPTLTLGSIQININNTVYPVGVSLTLEALPVSLFTGWNDITTPDVGDWTSIDEGSGSTWTDINATTSGTWTNVDDSGNSTTWTNVSTGTDNDWTEI